MVGAVSCSFVLHLFTVESLSAEMPCSPLVSCRLLFLLSLNVCDYLQMHQNMVCDEAEVRPGSTF